MTRRPFTLLGLATAALLFAAHPAAQAQSPELAPVPDDSIALRYFRTDGNYEGWGVHFWESFEKVQDGASSAARTRATCRSSASPGARR